MVKQKILFLTDYRGYLCGKFQGTIDKHTSSIVDVNKIIELLKERYEIECLSFQEVDFSKSYKGWYVVYASSEERGLLYKRYIEDILLHLQYDGARLIPEFALFRAHGNKAFQEMCRYQFKDKLLKKPKSYIVGRYEELQPDHFQQYPYIVKTSSGSGSCGVKIAKNEMQLVRIVKQMSKVSYYDQHFTIKKSFGYTKLIWMMKNLYRICKKSLALPRPMTTFYTNKVIIQEYIPNLSGDYKVLYYAGKYYVLNRKNREKDFRASGSGKFSFPDEVEEVADILDFALRVAKELGAPMISMDIAKNNDSCYLIEYQCVCFGPYTIQYSQWYFHYDEKLMKWEKINASSDIEAEIARSINAAIEL